MPKLVYHDSDQVERTLEMGADPIMIGRATECQVRTQDAMVSRRHARILWDGGYWIEDLGSSNGVYVSGGERIKERTPIRPGDEMRCGSIILKLMPEVSSRMTGRMAPVVAPPPPAYAEPPEAPAYAEPPEAPAYEELPEAPVVPLDFDLDVETVTGDRSEAPSDAGGGASGDAAQIGALTNELDAERARRVQLDFAVTNAEQRLTDATVENEKLQRRVEQLMAELRRMRGATGQQAPAADPQEIATLTAQCNQLKQRVAELEAQPAQAAPAEGDAAHLKRKVEQLTSEIRRLRSGQPAASAPVDDGRVAELEQRLAAAEQERDAARRQAQAAPAAVKQPAISPAAIDAASQINDALNDLRGSLRAAQDEIGLLGVEAPGDSVTVLKESLAAAHEQLETARSQLRELNQVIGSS